MGFSQARSVGNSEDLRRVVALPTREAHDSAALVRELTSIFRKPGGTWSLRPVQALALYEIAEREGLFGPIRVGGGKTLLSLLAPVALSSRRAVLLLPAALREKTRREQIELDKQWRVSRTVRLVSYEELGRVAAAELLQQYKPDLIIADEAHRLKNKRAGVTRRVARYMRENPGTRFVAISGTMMKRSLRDFAHILEWTHGEGAPIALNDGVLEEWADALDEDTNPFTRPEPGKLLTLATPDDHRDAVDQLQVARRGFHRRLVSTPGVVATEGEQVACSLYVRAVEYQPNDVTETNFAKLRGAWETPDGWALTQAVDVWRHARELALGMHYVWDPRPPEEWLLARKRWAKFVRDILARSRSLDTELQVTNAVRAKALPSHLQLEGDEAWSGWARLRDTFTINPKAVWHDTTALELCEAWMKKGAGIVWCEHSFFAEELSRRTGASYYGPQGLDRLARPIESASPKAAIIASVAANSTGRNLQAWSRNLITSCPAGASTWEQLLGRTHREGQQADEVEVDVLLACAEHGDAWHRSLSAAAMVRDTMGDAPKLLVADATFPAVWELAARKGARWQKTGTQSATPAYCPPEGDEP